MEAFARWLQEHPIIRGFRNVWWVPKGDICIVGSSYFFLEIWGLKVFPLGILWNPSVLKG